MRITTSVASVLAAFLADPEEGHYGLELMRATGLPSGTLYPILVRLQDAGWVEAHWEDVDPAAAGRPARRYYRLTPNGATSARSELQALQRKIGVLGKLAEGSA
ncbi:PadR family transcriptional regulator [Fodinicola acaciae]|uniref:PadR family transcriptional regulator n=1 Tax=Fodinicola acaciae TaxID=2681555 RepID=UPI0013D555C1|nr:PadR family transcriptional regulator [Fodinicola acaciae]